MTVRGVGVSTLCDCTLETPKPADSSMPRTIPAANAPTLSVSSPFGSDTNWPTLGPVSTSRYSSGDSSDFSRLSAGRPNRVFHATETIKESIATTDVSRRAGRVRWGSLASHILAKQSTATSLPHSSARRTPTCCPSSARRASSSLTLALRDCKASFRKPIRKRWETACLSLLDDGGKEMGKGRQADLFAGFALQRPVEHARLLLAQHMWSLASLCPALIVSSAATEQAPVYSFRFRVPRKQLRTMTRRHLQPPL